MFERYSVNKYSEKVKKATPPSVTVKNCIAAFLIGGLLCVFSEMLFSLISGYTDEINARTYVSMTLVVITAALTGLGIYDKLAYVAGAVIVYGCSLASLYGMIYYFFIMGQ